MTLLQRCCLSTTLAVLSGCQTYCASHPGECTPPPSFSGAGGARATSSCSGQREMGPPVEPGRPPPPITGGSLAAMDDGTWVVADADRAMVWHVDGTRVLGRYALRTDDQPGRVLSRGTHAYIALRHAGQIAELDLERGVLARFDTCTEPRALALRGDDLLIGCATGRIETSTREVVLDDAAVSDLRDLTVTADRLLISTFRDAQVFEVRGAQAPRVLHAPSRAPDANGRSFTPRVAWRMRGSVMVAQAELISSLPPFSSCNAYYAPPPGFDVGVVGTSVYRVEGTTVQPLATLAAAVLPVDVDENDVGALGCDARREHRDRHVDDDVSGAAHRIADALGLGRGVTHEDDRGSTRGAPFGLHRSPTTPLILRRHESVLPSATASRRSACPACPARRRP